MLKIILTAVLVFYCVMAWSVEPIGTPDRGKIKYPSGAAPSLAEVNLGKMLFFDPRISVNQTQSCATCHNPDLGLSDAIKHSLGAMGKRVNRHAPHLYNLAWSNQFFWDGRAASLEEQALDPIVENSEMNMPLPELITRLKAVPYYQKAFEQIYGSTAISALNISRANAAFERSLISDNSPFDQYIAGNKTAMSPAAIRGMELFEGKANCIECHDGPNFTDNIFHNIGVKSDDLGRGAITNDRTQNKAFKTPGLRNITLSAPYMHDGSEPSIQAVIRFYNQGGTDTEGLDNLIEKLNLS
ncbi:MAG: cytochrome B6 [Pseudomonadales bacterium]|nr:cytochrome B6 [Pseudomonadales bacterium]